MVFNLLLALAAVSAENYYHTDPFYATFLKNEGQYLGEPLKKLGDFVPPLHTEGRDVVDAKGEKVKMGCVNWAAHMETYMPEGLVKYTFEELASLISEMGFNCVRFTVSQEQFANLDTKLFDLRDKYRKDAQKFLEKKKNHKQKKDYKRLEYLSQVYDAITLKQQYNVNEEFRITRMDTVLDVLDVAMKALAGQNLFVILDNHMTEAKWCCGLFDGNRFFGHKHLQVDDWVSSLSNMTQTVADQGWYMVVGIGLRNEVHATYERHQSQIWFDAMRKGAAAVAAVQGVDLLIIVSGLTSGSYLKMLKTESFLTTEMQSRKYAEFLNNKIVFEIHFYNLIYIRPFWKTFGNKNTCRYMNWFLNSRVGFMFKDGQGHNAHPLWLSEFGLDISKYQAKNHKDSDTRWMKCLSNWMVEKNVDFGFWQLNSQYYMRSGVPEYKEPWGLLDESKRNHIRNPEFLHELQKLMLTPRVSDPKEGDVENLSNRRHYGKKSSQK